MIASSLSLQPQSAPLNLQNSLTAEAQTAEQAGVVTAMIPQTAIDEFALRFSAAMIELLAAPGVSDGSLPSKKLRAYTAMGVAPVKTTSRFV